MIRAAAALLLAAVLSGCAAQTIALAENAALVELDGSTWAIVSEAGHILVYPNVTGITCTGEVAFGIRELATSNTDGSEPFTSGLGYFLFFPESGGLSQGLKRDEITAALDERGVEFHEPHLVDSYERLWNGCG